jgi:hypothetical protein
MTKDEALKLALDYIVATNKSSQFWLVPESNLNKTVTAIKQALAAPVQEPVRGWWAHTSPITGITDVQDWQLTKDDKARGWIEREIYTTPPAAQRQWVELTLEDMETTHWSPDFRAGAKWAAAKLKEKNT